jgi:hypothetical protein
VFRLLGLKGSVKGKLGTALPFFIHFLNRTFEVTMKKQKKLIKQLEILSLQREILLVAKDIDDIQSGTYQQEKKIGFDTGESCVGYAVPAEDEEEYDD